MSQERPIRLHAGQWSLEFERWSGWVRCVRLGGHEVLRAVYAVVRGDHWETYSQRVVHTHISQGSQEFEAVWNIDLDDLAFQWSGHLKCNGQELEIEWSGTPTQNLTTRRTGLCVLHPQELAGTACSVVHVNGSEMQGSFPKLVDPTSPFTQIGSISHPVAGADCHIEFAGEVFEMEDQRNWTDASFKTYCLPEPGKEPYELRAGEGVRHRVRLRFDGDVQAIERACTVELVRTGRRESLPMIGTRSKNPDPRFRFNLSPDLPDAWTQAGFGTIHSVPGSFVELNRNREIPADCDGVAFAVSPQVHAADDRTAMENVHGLVGPVATARAVFPGKKICVGPIRFGGKTKGREHVGDPRLQPAWFLASLATLSEAKVDAACYFNSGDFQGPLQSALEIIVDVAEIEIFKSSDPYRAVGFGLPDGRAVLINLRPYPTSVALGEDVDLDPYEICELT
jgi:hypothetical protein